MMNNPFEKIDNNKSLIWDMLVRRDILAFTSQDWSMIAADFSKEEFMGINGNFNGNPDEWTLDFPDIESYKIEWLRQAKAFSETNWVGDPMTIVSQCTILQQIDIHGDLALVHKKFKGDLVKTNGERVAMNWQTLYRCRRIEDNWKIAGFTGYLPHWSGPGTNQGNKSIHVPANAKQHKTSGPYSPVLIVIPSALVVISGQAAIDIDGNVVGTTIEEQTSYTLDNCLKQLASAGCSFDDVFKVNVYLKN
ncbi:MAG: RidA family protein, partial [Chitinophagaceae bacterium]